jgi:hypothetical protein
MKPTGERQQGFGDRSRVGYGISLRPYDQIETDGHLSLLATERLANESFPVIADNCVTQATAGRDT